MGLPRAMDDAGAGSRWASAGELGDFVYCRRAWWWKRHPEELPRGVQHETSPEDRDRGQRFHAQVESADMAPHHASRWPYAVLLLLLLGASAFLGWWWGFL